jgi:glycogen debranching enzyme
MYLKKFFRLSHSFSWLYIALFLFQTVQAQTMLVDQIPISVKGNSRTFTFTNKRFGQFHGESNAQTEDGWRGWIFREQNIFTDYQLLLNGKMLERALAEVTITPYNVSRTYAENIRETVFFADTCNLLRMKLENVTGELLLKLNGISFTSSRPINETTVVVASERLPQSYLMRISSNRTIPGVKNGGLIFGDGPHSCDIIIEILPETDVETAIIPDIDQLIANKKERINKILERSEVKTNNSEFNKAYLWAIASMDALVTTQDVKGIFAGLPWFNNNWGRDTFISLPGATFSINNIAEAKEILESFAEFQITDSSSHYFGRVPNRVTLKDSIYNTTDGTPWFAIQAMNYVNYSGDFAFLRRVYPVLKTAIAGAEKYYLDSLGFLTHRDAETWMDAVGPEGPWSPRGNRAIDIQVLWLRELIATKIAAQYVNDAVIVSKCENLIQLLDKNIPAYFFNPENHQIADRIKQNGEKDFSRRPNALFACNEQSLFSSKGEQFTYFREAMKDICTPYGLLSLSSADSHFHPYHEYPPYYPKDAAYHNGIIWQWNTGIAVANLCKFGLADSAWQMTSALTKQILGQGAAGTIAELMEAFPRPGEKNIRLSGAFSQAWSLAEYLRSVKDDYLGVRCNALDSSVVLSPHLPKALQEVKFQFAYCDAVYSVNYVQKDSVLNVTVTLSKAGKVPQFSLEFQNDTYVAVYHIPAAKGSFSFSINQFGIRDAKQLSGTQGIWETTKPGKISKLPRWNLGAFSFSHPQFDSSIPSVHQPDYLLLSHEQIKHHGAGAAKMIYSKPATKKDERYTYPGNSNFVDGILDLIKFDVVEIDSYYSFRLEFRNLNDPKWHPEYGFQLTYAAILIGKDGQDGCIDPGKNSKYILKPSEAFQKAVYIGGGVEISDCNKGIIAKYIPAPADIAEPLGDVKLHTVQFTLPQTLIGDITTGTHMTVLIGGQDDSGGAGLGVFRDVKENAGEWNGGGKRDTGHNIYDILKIP